VIKDIHKLVKEYWGFDNFRPLQQEIIQSVLDGNDTLALMPTGGGKSLCYQVPGLAKEGLCLVNPMHISASVFINDNESGLHHDYEVWLEKLAPHAPTSQYRHNDTGEDNADAHLKRQVMGREVVVAVTQGKLDFGPWEQIFYGEFDGRRKKRVLIKVIGE